MPFTIEYKPGAWRELRALPRDVQARIQPAIESLADNPFPDRRKKMKGYENRWRIAVGRYRVVYEIYSHRLLILVIAVGHRREIYR